ncbi:DMT family transporter [Lacibacter sp. H375]|uniref:DMT family transporter n=1 Tax=Lacibacter sp. H375 TaxID=3133424 RepID=UPI0030BF33CE
MSTTQTNKAHLAILATNLIFGINFSVVKYISPSLIKPFGLNFIRVSVAVLLFWFLFLLKPSNGGIYKKDIPRFLLCALTGVAINQLLFIKGLTLTTPIHGALLILVTPVFILLLGFLLRTEKITVLRLTGLASGICGAVLLILSRENSVIGSNMVLGDVLVVINAISYAFYYVLVKPLMKKYTPIHIIRWVFSLGFIMVLPFCWHEFITIDWSLFDTSHFAALAFVVLGATFFAYYFTVYGLQHLSAASVGAYIYLQPLFSAIVSAIFFHETVSGYKLIAAALIFTGVYLVNRKKTVS